MTKAAIEKFVSELEAIGVTEYFLRIEGGNRVISHGNDSSRLILEDDRQCPDAAFEGALTASQTNLPTMPAERCTLQLPQEDPKKLDRRTRAH